MPHVLNGALNLSTNFMDKGLTGLKGFGEGDPKPERSSKSKALKGKMGSAHGINAERKRQGYKPMDAKRNRIHEGMDKYL